MADEDLIRPFDEANPQDGMPMKNFVMLLAGAVVVGSVLGFGVSRLAGGDAGRGKAVTGPVEKVAGVQDKKTFKDKAEGILEEGGIEGEGSYHLQRPGGESQNVYLTSSTVDLSGYVGKKVRVWGETFTGEKAGWLMDVGLVEVL